MTSLPPKKSLGQNFLVDENVVTKIAAAVRLSPEDTALEIGPGLGVLTRELARRAGRVVAIELDERLFHRLKADLREFGNIDIILGDALKFPYEQLKERVKVAANLPYYISTPIISRLIAARDNIALMVLMLQKEVAERITAPPGGKEYGYLSVMVQLYTVPEMLFGVGRESFKPVPKVDSAVVRLVTRPAPAAPCRDYALFEKVVGAAFSQRRKTLKNSLRSSPLFAGVDLDTLKDIGIDPIRRAETLSVSEFAAISDFLFEIRKSK